jgi:hypothetical protein
MYGQHGSCARDGCLCYCLSAIEARGGQEPPDGRAQGPVGKVVLGALAVATIAAVAIWAGC